MTGLLNGYKEENKLLGKQVYCTPTPEELKKFQGLRELAQGQTVTMRGVMGNLTFPMLRECRFVAVGPTPALPVSLAGLKAMLENLETRKKYRNQVLARVKVVEGKVTRDGAIWTVTDPGGIGAVRVNAYATCRFSEVLKKEFAAIRPGDVIILLAEAWTAEEPFRLWDARVLKNPPAGITLHGEK